MNSVNLVGRLTRDPELRYTQSQMAVASFSIAIDRPPRKDGNTETDFPNIKVFGAQAENCEKYLSKGKMVGIEGRLQTGQYDKDGHTVYFTEVVANRVEFLTPRGEAGQGGQQKQQRQERPQRQQTAEPDFEALDEDVPF